MTAERWRLSLACFRGDGGQCKAAWGRWEGPQRGVIYAVPSSQGPVMAGEGGGGVRLLALGDRYRPELRRQNLHSP